MTDYVAFGSQLHPQIKHRTASFVRFISRTVSPSGATYLVTMVSMYACLFACVAHTRNFENVIGSQNSKMDHVSDHSEQLLDFSRFGLTCVRTKTFFFFQKSFLVQIFSSNL